MERRFAPYKCPCGGFFYSLADFRSHLQYCLEFVEFTKVVTKLFKSYDEMQKHFENPEDFT